MLIPKGRFPGRSQATPAKEGMSPRIVLRPEAEADLLQARHWYEQERSYLPKAERNIVASEISKTQIDKLGERLKKGEITDADLRLLDEYRRSFLRLISL